MRQDSTRSAATRKARFQRAISALAGLEYHAHFCLAEEGERDEATLARSLSARRTAGFPIPLDAARAMLDLAGCRASGPDGASAS